MWGLKIGRCTDLEYENVTILKAEVEGGGKSRKLSECDWSHSSRLERSMISRESLEMTITIKLSHELRNKVVRI